MYIPVYIYYKAIRLTDVCFWCYRSVASCWWPFDFRSSCQTAEEFDDWHAGGSWSFTHSRRVIASDAKYHNIPWLPKRKRERERESEEANMYTQANKLIISMSFFILVQNISESYEEREREREMAETRSNDYSARREMIPPEFFRHHHWDLFPTVQGFIVTSNQTTWCCRFSLGFVLPTMLPHLLQPSSAQHTNWAEIFYGLKVLSLKLHTGAYAAATRTAQ